MQEAVRPSLSALGMKINPHKTQMVCMSASTEFEVSSYIRIGEEVVESGDTLKIVGFHFGKHPNINLHFENMKKKFYARVWAIRNLKKNELLF